MNRSEVKELFFITPIDNLESILTKGIMCFQAAKKLNAKSIADNEVQKRREKIIPGINKKVHSYANLYFNPRNPMMYKRQELHEKLCIISIDESILDEPDVIIADGNASSDYTRFESSPKGLKMIDVDYIFTKYWTSDDYFDGLERKRRICAEVLVYNKVDVHFIKGIYVSCMETKNKIIAILNNNPILRNMFVKPKLFFQD